MEIETDPLSIVLKVYSVKYLISNIDKVEFVHVRINSVFGMCQY